MGTFIADMPIGTDPANPSIAADVAPAAGNTERFLIKWIAAEQDQLNNRADALGVALEPILQEHLSSLRARGMGEDRVAEIERIERQAMAMRGSDYRLEDRENYRLDEAMNDPSALTMAELKAKFPLGSTVTIGPNAPQMMVIGWSPCDPWNFDVPSVNVFWLDDHGAPHRETLPAVAYKLVK
jgi:hypothetical protein